MSRLNDIRAQSTWSDILEGQPQHLGIAIFMGVGAVSLLNDPPGAARVFFLSSHSWAVISILMAILHQAVVALVFRLQLHRNWMSLRFGQRDMRVWAMIFMPLLAFRPISIILVGWADATPITGWRIAELIPGVALLGLAIWGMYSVLVYFTLPRALGGDHFRDEYAAMPLVRRGAFKYTPNAMYGLVFLGLWGIALAFGSWNAAVVALFQHAYIWVHMYCTESPDMRWIYSNPDPTEIAVAKTINVPDHSAARASKTP